MHWAVRGTQGIVLTILQNRNKIKLVHYPTEPGKDNDLLANTSLTGVQHLQTCDVLRQPREV